MKYEKLFSLFKIGTLELKNRVVMEPMLMGFGQIDGKVTPQMAAYYEERAKGGTGLIVTEITRVNDVTGASSFGQLAVSHDYHIAPLAEMAKRIHKHGAKLMVELHHPGRQNLGLMIGTVPLSVACEKFVPKYRDLLFGIVPAGRKLMEKNIVPPVVSPSECEVSKFSGCKNRALSLKEIKQLIGQFIDGAERVKKAGCDGVYLHAAHGYLIQQFLSPHTNKRTDVYGGSLENRMRFLLEILTGVKKRCGADFPVVVRLSVDEMYASSGRPGVGYTLEEGVQIARRLEENGVDAIDVSCGAYDTFNSWLEPVSYASGWRTPMIQAVKQAVSVPVIAVNLTRTPEQAEALLESGVQDMIGLGRPLIADPYWCQKAQNAQEKLIKHCICCLYCFESMEDGAFRGTCGHCSVNPFVGREPASLQKNGSGRKVAVVGAGVAGLTAAELLARRGFAVTVYEKNDHIGGQVYLASRPPQKERTYWCAQDIYENALALGVHFEFSCSVSADMLVNAGYAAVIVATGADAVFPQAMQQEHVYTSSDVLDGSVSLNGKKVIVVGSGLTGLETAEMLCAGGNQVTVVEMADSVAPGAWFQQTDDLLPKLKKQGTVFYTSSKFAGLQNGAAVLQNAKSKQELKLPCDAVVLALGARPQHALYDALQGKVPALYRIGDAVQVGRIADAVRSAFETVQSIQ